MNFSLRKYLELTFWILALNSIGYLIGYYSQTNVDTWYETLNRSPLTPPNYMFGIVWTCLYTMIAISGWLIFKHPATPNMRPVKKLFIMQLILNWSWTPTFFSLHLTGAALVILVSLVICVGLLILKTYQDTKIASLLLVPYILWLLLATHLNVYIWMYN